MDCVAYIIKGATWLYVVAAHGHCTIIYRSMYSTDGCNIVTPLQRTGTHLVVFKRTMLSCIMIGDILGMFIEVMMLLTLMP
jgi:hypothetical protein